MLLTLVKIGVFSYSGLSKMRRYMIVINLVLGALLTTPPPAPACATKVACQSTTMSV